MSKPVRFLKPGIGRNYSPRQNTEKESADSAKKVIPPRVPENVPSASGSSQQVPVSIQDVPQRPPNSGYVFPLHRTHPHLAPEGSFDRDSAIGRFTWKTLPDEKWVPCIFRNGELYVAVCMAEVSVLGHLTKRLPSGRDGAGGIKIPSFYATPAEAKLLNWINTWHSNEVFREEAFSIYDTVIRLVDLETLYKWMRRRSDSLRVNSSHSGIRDVSWTDVQLNQVFSNYSPVMKGLTFETFLEDQLPALFQWRCCALTLKDISDVGRCRNRLITIPELTREFKEGDYVIKWMQVYYYWIPCVNAKPGQQDEFLISLAGIHRYFFPNQGIYPTLVSALWGEGILTYLPNEFQMKAFSDSGLKVIDSRKYPLLLATEALDAVNKLRELIKPSAIAELDNLVNQPGNFVIVE